MASNALHRVGELLDVLAQMSDVERQLVVQGQNPYSFVPNDLLENWYQAFEGRRALQSTDVSDDVVAVLADFGYQLDQIVDILPDNADDKEAYIRDNEVWRAIRELADWTLTRITILTVPETPEFGLN
jgi:hypothetical protein